MDKQQYIQVALNQFAEHASRDAADRDPDLEYLYQTWRRLQSNADPQALDKFWSVVLFEPWSDAAKTLKGMYMARLVTRAEFDKAVEAVWTELEYQNSLYKRTDDEAKDVPGFLTLGRRYMRKVEDVWADVPGTPQSDGTVVVPEAEDGLRKLAAIFLRAMIYTHIRPRITGKG